MGLSPLSPSSVSSSLASSQADTNCFNRLEIFGLTLLGESESLGEAAMRDNACIIMNRKAANLSWMGGDDERNICLKSAMVNGKIEYQFDCWMPGKDRARIMDIGLNKFTDENYKLALQIAESAMAGSLPDDTNGAVSYYDPPAFPYWAKGQTPCFTRGTRKFYSLEQIMK